MTYSLFCRMIHATTKSKLHYSDFKKSYESELRNLFYQNTITKRR